MSFLHPEFLYYMLPPLFILFGLLLTQTESQAEFFSDEVMSRLRVSANTLTLRARNALFFLMGFFIILALAHPVINEGVVEVKAKSADIMIAMDISDSMLGEDVYPNRLKLAKEKAMELLKIAPNERIGVIAFAKNSYLVSPLSFDHSAVGFLLRQLDTNSITEKGTDFLSMLEAVNNSLESESKKYLLILSDGGDESDFSKETAYAKEKNIVVFVLGMGTLKGTPIKLESGSFIKHKGEIIVSKLNENIGDLATKSGGVYIQNTKSSEDIEAMLQEIEHLSEKKELKSKEIQRYIPLFYYPLGMAMLLFLIATSSMSKRVRVELPSVFVLFLLLFAVPHAKAGLLDFVELAEAKEAYEKGEYAKASELYLRHGELSKNPQSYYNAGNAFYKLQKYEEAMKAYEKAKFGNEKESAKNLANMGNTHVKQAKEQSLQEAVAVYENSLKLDEDKQTRENLEAVKKFLEKKKQEEEQKKQEEKEQQSQKDENNSSKQEQEPQEQEEKSEKKSDEDKTSENEQQKNKEEQKDKEEKQEQKEQDKESQESNQTRKETPQDANVKEEKMSDAEEAKWLEQLNLQQNTYMYRLNDQKPQKEDSDEKPW